jgi:hypothetical protein
MAVATAVLAMLGLQQLLDLEVQNCLWCGCK